MDRAAASLPLMFSHRFLLPGEREHMDTRPLTLHSPRQRGGAGGRRVGVLGVLTLVALPLRAPRPVHLSPLGTQSDVPTHVQDWTHT